MSITVLRISTIKKLKTSFNFPLKYLQKKSSIYTSSVSDPLQFSSEWFRQFHTDKYCGQKHGHLIFHLTITFNWIKFLLPLPFLLLQEKQQIFSLDCNQVSKYSFAIPFLKLFENALKLNTACYKGSN